MSDPTPGELFSVEGMVVVITGGATGRQSPPQQYHTLHRLTLYNNQASA
jgi:hypothetical protein